MPSVTPRDRSRSPSITRLSRQARHASRPASPPQAPPSSLSDTDGSLSPRIPRPHHEPGGVHRGSALLSSGAIAAGPGHPRPRSSRGSGGLTSAVTKAAIDAYDPMHDEVSEMKLTLSWLYAVGIDFVMALWLCLPVLAQTCLDLLKRK